MTHSDLILELLDEIFPNSYCDDCLSNELGIQPRQQVNQLGRRLADHERTYRQRGICSACKKPKTINTLNKSSTASPAASLNPIRTSLAADRVTHVEEFDIEDARTQIVRICHQIWEQHKQSAPPHSISSVINSLRSEGILSSHQANMMLTLCNLRNVYVYESMQMGPREIEIAKNALSIVQEWWSKFRQ